MDTTTTNTLDTTYSARAVIQRWQAHGWDRGIAILDKLIADRDEKRSGLVSCAVARQVSPAAPVTISSFSDLALVY